MSEQTSRYDNREPNTGDCPFDSCLYFPLDVNATVRDQPTILLDEKPATARHKTELWGVQRNTARSSLAKFAAKL